MADVITGQVLYAIRWSPDGFVGLLPKVYEHRSDAVAHLDGLSPHIAARCVLLTLQVLSVEPGARGERETRDTIPAPPEVEITTRPDLVDAAQRGPWCQEGDS